jgi:hypothetical protein
MLLTEGMNIRVLLFLMVMIPILLPENIRRNM